eukprot:743012-Prymnesium_polylepis.1
MCDAAPPPSRPATFGAAGAAHGPPPARCHGLGPTEPLPHLHVHPSTHPEGGRGRMMANRLTHCHAPRALVLSQAFQHEVWNNTEAQRV